MEEEHIAEYIRTTIYLPRELHESAKRMAIYTRSNLSKIMRIALREKIDKLRGVPEEKQND